MANEAITGRHLRKNGSADLPHSPQKALDVRSTSFAGPASKDEFEKSHLGDPPRHPPVPRDDSHPHNPRVRLNRPPEASHVLPHSDQETSDVRSCGGPITPSVSTLVRIQAPHTNRQSLLPHAAPALCSRRPTPPIERRPSIRSKQLLESLQSRRSSKAPHKLMQRHRDRMIQTIAHGNTALLGLAGGAHRVSAGLSLSVRNFSVTARSGLIERAC